MKTMKELTERISAQDYAKNFWNAMKFDSEAALHINDDLDGNTGGYVMPKASEDEFRSIVSKNGTVRNLATVYKKYDGSSNVWAYESDDYASFVEEGGSIPGFDVIDDFTKIKVGAYKLASLAKLSCEFA